MKAGKFFAELKRRNVYKVAVAYGIAAWLLIQIATQVFPFFAIPDWAIRLVIVSLLLGFLPALVFSWIFELTPEGLKRTDEVLPHESITRHTGRKLDFVIIAVLLAVLTLLLLNPREKAPPLGAATEKSIAVLPFQNMSDEKENAYFADGIQDDILTALSKVADLKVISRFSVIGYAPTAGRNLKEIGKALGVAHILEGSVRREGHRVRVTARLVDIRTESDLWAERYDRDLTDVFAIQNEIAHEITKELQATLSPRERSAIEEKPTQDVEAFDLYTRAKTLRLTSNFGPLFKDRMLQAVALLKRAIARDAQFSLAWCELARVHDLLYFAGYDHTLARLVLADRAVEMAAQLAPDAGATRLASAQHFYHGYRDYDRARRELEIARELLPNSPDVFALIGYVDRRQGRWAESTRSIERAVELDPRNPFTLGQIAVNYLYQHRYAEAAASLDRTLEIVPKALLTRISRAWIDVEWRADTRQLHATIDKILAEDANAGSTVAADWLFLALCERDTAAAERALVALSGDDALTLGHLFLSRAFGEALVARVRGDAVAERAAFTRARTQQEAIVRAQPEYGPALSVLGLIDAGLGQKEDALRAGRRALQLMSMERDALAGSDIIMAFAIICAWTGEKDLALEQLTLATAQPGLISYGQLKLQPWWDGLRGDPRFEQIVATLAPKDAEQAALAREPQAASR